MHKAIVSLGIKPIVRIILGIGLALRVLIAIFVFPRISQEYFLPFFQLQGNPFDFSATLTEEYSGTSPFPYGLPMYFVFLPVYLTIKLMNSASFSIPIKAALFIVAIVPDYLIARFLIKLKLDFKVLVLWIFSPIVLWSTYYSGQTDLWPAYLFLASCYLFLEKKKYHQAGALLGLAIGCKYGLMIVLPFILVFMLDNPRYKNQIRQYLTTALLISGLCYTPILFSENFRSLVFGSQTTTRILGLYIDLQNFKFYLVPATYLLLLVWIYRAGRTTAKVLIIFLSVSIVSIALFTPGVFGWVIWSLPTLFAFLDIKTSRLLWVLAAFQLIYFAAKSEIFENIDFISSTWVHSGLNTTLTVFTVFLLIRLLQHGVRQGDIYQLAEKPFSVAIAGDSGVGKDTFATALINAFGEESSSVICGDDFHLFERGDFVWGNHTHLNPRMNDLEHWSHDISKAVIRERYKTQEYDHENGRFTKTKVTLKSDLVISQGLHALYPQTGSAVDAHIFVEMDFALRLSLKMERDIKNRNRTKEEVMKQLSDRENDYLKYIEIQKHNADLEIKFLENVNLQVQLVEITSNKSSKLLDIITSEILAHAPEALIYDEQISHNSVRIDTAFLESATVESILRKQLHSYDQFFPREPKFSSGVNGFLQLTTFLAIDNYRGKKRENYAKFE